MKKFTHLTMLLTLALVLSIIESFFPLFGGVIPGFKIGLANIVILVTLISYGFKEALFVSIMRVFLMGLLRTGLFNVSFFLSFTGAILSLIAMFLASKTKLFSLIGISIIGSVFHSIGQIFGIVLFMRTTSMFYYLPILIICSLITGTVIGMLAKYIIKTLPSEKNML